MAKKEPAGRQDAWRFPLPDALRHLFRLPLDRNTECPPVTAADERPVILPALQRPAQRKALIRGKSPSRRLAGDGHPFPARCLPSGSKGFCPFIHPAFLTRPSGLSRRMPFTVFPRLVTARPVKSAAGGVGGTAARILALREAYGKKPSAISSAMRGREPRPVSRTRSSPSTIRTGNHRARKEEPARASPVAAAGRTRNPKRYSPLKPGINPMPKSSDAKGDSRESPVHKRLPEVRHCPCRRAGTRFPQGQASDLRPVHPERRHSGRATIPFSSLDATAVSLAIARRGFPE